jgi:hypothetical protein
MSLRRLFARNGTLWVPGDRNEGSLTEPILHSLRAVLRGALILGLSLSVFGQIPAAADASVFPQVGTLFCAVHDPAALQYRQAENADRRVWITKDVPVLRIDHISIKGMLLGVWQVSTAVSVNPDPREIRRKLSPQSARL